MNEHNPADPYEHTVDTVLTALGEASPRPGFENRLLQRLALQPVKKSPPFWRSPAFAASVAGAVVAFGALALVRRGTASSAASPRVFTTATQQGLPHAGPLAPAPLSLQSRSTPPRLWHSESGNHSRALQSSGNGSNGGAVPSNAPPAQTSGSREPGFPAPEMPLTEQERLLLEIARRNDPVQVAMLDPIERSLRLREERAEITRFFTPPPLPPEVQQQIDAAIRSQYVNAPPPAQTNNDRSIP